MSLCFLLFPFLVSFFFCRCFQVHHVVKPSGRHSSGRWARDHDLPAFPASPYHFALRLRHLMADAATASPIEFAVHAIAGG